MPPPIHLLIAYAVWATEHCAVESKFVCQSTHIYIGCVRMYAVEHKFQHPLTAYPHTTPPIPPPHRGRPFQKPYTLILYHLIWRYLHVVHCPPKLALSFVMCILGDSSPSTVRIRCWIGASRHIWKGDMVITHRLLATSSRREVGGGVQAACDVHHQPFMVLHVDDCFHICIYVVSV